MAIITPDEFLIQTLRECQERVARCEKDPRPAVRAAARVVSGMLISHNYHPFAEGVRLFRSLQAELLEIEESGDRYETGEI